jgi:hypothetical protein
MNYSGQKNLFEVLLGTIFCLSFGLPYLCRKGFFQASFCDIATGLIAGGVVVGMVLCIIYLVKKQLNAKGLCPDEIGDERAKLIQYKAAFKTLQCLSALIFLVPIFLFIDYKLSLIWTLLCLFLLINLLYVGFILFYSKRYI